VHAGVQLCAAAAHAGRSPGGSPALRACCPWLRRSCQALSERLGSRRVCERACGANGCRLPAFAGQLPHSITALAVQKDLTFAAVRADILVCQRVHWCAARLACVARLRSAVSHRLPQAGPAQQREQPCESSTAACCTAHLHA